MPNQSDMTPEGWRDFQRGRHEITAQRSNRRSHYNGVSRIHCRNGYVDIQHTASNMHPEQQIRQRENITGDINGIGIADTVEAFRAWCHAERISIYDYHKTS